MRPGCLAVFNLPRIGNDFLITTPVCTVDIYILWFDVIDFSGCQPVNSKLDWNDNLAAIFEAK